VFIVISQQKINGYLLRLISLLKKPPKRLRALVVLETFFDTRDFKVNANSFVTPTSCLSV
jgi:hypothetical protein